LTLKTEAGRFDDCVKVVETTPLEPGEQEFKIYCPNVGLTVDEDLVLKMIVDPGT